MTDKKKGNKKAHPEQDSFGQIIKSMSDFFHERPVRGLLQTMDEFFKVPLTGSSFPAEMAETETDYIIKAELPGINKESLNIDIIGNELKITVKNVQILTEEDEKNHLYRSRQWNHLSSRTFSLPYAIEEESVSATYKDGLLLIKITKQKGRKVEIQE